jgi:rfaE bifunctional protein kinase chain/domain/rfaE bifunctional protein nucleotidyltransferase chain/domain
MKIDHTNKIKHLSQISRIVKDLKKEGKIIVQCHGVFDLIHPGHIRHFASAKKHGDILIVSITADAYVRKGPGRPIFSQQLRAEVLAAMTDIDFVTIVESENAIQAIKTIRPNIYIKGPDYKNRPEKSVVPRKLGVEEEAVKSVGGKLVYTDDILFSSSKLINNYLEVYPTATKKYLEKLKKKYTADFIIEKLASLSELKILVIGDAIIDQYCYCSPLGKSSKEPVMVHRYIVEESFAGGTLATANHTAALSKHVSLLTVLGKENSYWNVISQFTKPGVHPVYHYQSNRNTIVKRRFLDMYTKQKLFQVSYITDDPIDELVEAKIIRFLKDHIKKFDLVIINDFGHGIMTKKIIRYINTKANYLALNVQTNSANYGFNVVTKYPRADFLCIDEQELRLATHDKQGDIQKLMRRIYNKLKCRHMIVTRGFEGTVEYGSAGFIHTPSLTDKVVDRVGAGDALFAITSPCIYAGIPPDLVSFIGNIAGALQVQVVGNKKPIEFGEIAKFITRLLK